ncbi:sentrin-specific protease 5-like [Pempheris klunzingeri]|uniref:sentrin-specific protease 5-like n=1 Tax=Pempheris klunzingeri TaxID=3127111 RepID=UPI00398092AF
MVHSGSASPMKTTPSASPHLTVPATASPLQAAPLVPPPGDATDQDLTHTPGKLLTTDLISNSDSTQPSAPSPANAKPHQAFATNSSSASAWCPTQTPIPGLGTINGRKSSRKRTPKACDCCGPNSTGHNDSTSGRGRGRGKGRRRGPGGDLWDTPKRKVDGQLTHIKSFGFNQEMLEETEDEDDRHDAPSQMPGALPVTLSPQDGPIRADAAPEKGDVEKKEAMLMDGSGVAGDGRDVEMRLLGMVGSGASAVRGCGRGGRGMVGALLASNIEVESGGKRGGLSGVVISSESPFGNGETVNLSDTEPEEEVKEGKMIMSEMENGLLSVSQQPGPASSSESPQDLEMQMDQTPDRTDSVSVPITLSNGDVVTPTRDDYGSTLMEVETSHPARVLPPSQGPIAVSSMQHSWALRDHRLYCQCGTWEETEKEEMSGKDHSGETDGREMDGKMPDKESLEHLTDMIHEFLESFYLKYGGFIPLSETDVLEHLKKKGNSDLSSRGLEIKEAMARYRAGLASAPFAGFMVTYNKHTLGLEDLGTLEEQNWLNDQIINMYGELIMEATQHKVHFFNSFFHKQLVAKGYDGVKRWTKKVDLFSKWLLLIPIHLEIHWSLVTVTMATKTISYYDSQGIVFRHTTDNIMKYLLSEAREKKQAAFQKGWKITIIKGIPQQKNDSDCGVFVLEYCRCLSVKQPLLFCQEDMPRIRKRIYKELCDCRLNV